MAPGAAQKSSKLINPQLWRLQEPSRRHILKMFFHIWALTNLNIINPKGHKCSCLGRTRPDGSKIGIFTSASRFLVLLCLISFTCYILYFLYLDVKYNYQCLQQIVVCQDIYQHYQQWDIPLSLTNIANLILKWEPNSRLVMIFERQIILR